MIELTIGKKLKYFRLRSGLTQLELELDINAASGTISRLEQDKVNPTKETLFLISKSLSLTKSEISYLFGIIEKEEITELKFVVDYNASGNY